MCDSGKKTASGSLYDTATCYCYKHTDDTLSEAYIGSVSRLYHNIDIISSYHPGIIYDCVKKINKKFACYIFNSIKTFFFFLFLNLSVWLIKKKKKKQDVNNMILATELALAHVCAGVNRAWGASFKSSCWTEANGRTQRPPMSKSYCVALVPSAKGCLALPALFTHNPTLSSQHLWSSISVRETER